MEFGKVEKVHYLNVRSKLRWCFLHVLSIYIFLIWEQDKEREKEKKRRLAIVNVYLAIWYAQQYHN